MSYLEKKKQSSVNKSWKFKNTEGLLSKAEISGKDQ